MAGTGEANNATISNYLYGGTGDDALVSSGKTDFLYGETGNDIFMGAAGVDLMEDSSGNSVFFGAAGSDNTRLSEGTHIVLGGTGNDLIDGDFDAAGYRGAGIIAFNKSDGQETVNRLGTGSTISIGGGTLYSNLSLEVQGTALRLKTGSSHYISLNDWYANPANKSVSRLQIVIEGTRDFDPSSSDPLKIHRLQVFDFLGLVAAFDAARAAGQNFKVADNLGAYLITGSSEFAIGGAIAYEYARTGSISSLTYDQMRAVISSSNLGSWQPIIASQAMSAESSATIESTDTAALSAPLTLESGVTEATTQSNADNGHAAPDTPEEFSTSSSDVLFTASYSDSEMLSAPHPSAAPIASEVVSAPAVITGRSVTFSAAAQAQPQPFESDNASYPDAFDAAQQATGIAAQTTGDAVRQAQGVSSESDDS